MAEELRKQLAEQIGAHLPATLAILEKMVKLNSFTMNTDGVSAVAQLSAESFAPLGLEADIITSTEGYGNHLFLSGKGSSAVDIALVGHMDTVFPPEEEKRNNHRWRVDGDKIYGPGTWDMKGGNAMIYLVLATLKDVVPNIYSKINWHVLLSACEEVLNAEFARLAFARLPKSTQGVLVFEGDAHTGGAWNIIKARKGRLTYRITVSGRGAHAGSNHRIGANAIVQMAEIVEKLNAITNYDNELTCNIGTIKGGEGINRVAEEVVLELEIRAFDEKLLRDAGDKIEALKTYSTVISAEGGFACKTNVELVEDSKSWPENAASNKLIELWSAQAQTIGQKVTGVVRGGLSDGNFFCKDFPTIDGLGPTGANAHCSETGNGKEAEYINTPSFAPKALLNCLSIIELIG